MRAQFADFVRPAEKKMVASLMLNELIPVYPLDAGRALARHVRLKPDLQSIYFLALHRLMNNPRPL